jgi:L-arabinokinase
LRTIAFYISGHGFGHASRNIEIINAILARTDDVRIIARTSAAKWLFDRTINTGTCAVDTGTYGGRDFSRAIDLDFSRAVDLDFSRAVDLDFSRLGFTRIETETDTGAVQIDSLHLDEAATVAQAREFMRTFESRVTSEAEFLRAHNVGLVVADIPALGIAAAKHAGVAAVGLGNFTWDWIYSAYAGADDVVRQIGEAYALADVALRLPLHGGFDTFNRIVDIPFVARSSSRDPDDTRRALGLPRNERLVLLSFGGYGLERIRQDTLATLDGYVVIGSASRPLDERAMYDAGFRYEDVVRAVDVVMSKPGYGIISECIANDTALLYTSRGRFIEYDVFVREMPRFVRSRFISHADLFAGHWREPLDALVAQSAPPERAAVNGADVAATLLLEMV